MRTLAIGDIHGCLAPLLTLWKSLDPTPEDHIILSDFVNRFFDVHKELTSLEDMSDEPQQEQQEIDTPKQDD